MILSLIAAAVIAYLLVMFIVHEMFKKFFHMVLIIGLIMLAAAFGYISLKGII